MLGRARPVNERRLQLSTAVATCHTQHQARAGAPSIAADIQAQGLCVSVRTVGRLQANYLDALFNGRSIGKASSLNTQVLCYI